jgi:translation initiation factor 2 alpha subunit (eIF-2alpha)
VENVLRGSHVELETLELPKEKIEELLESIVRHRFTATKVTIEADIRVSCFSRDGAMPTTED